MKVYIGADHRGFQLKEALKTWLSENTMDFEDVGAQQLDPNDDYPKYAEAVAKKVSENPGTARGIVICGSGVGVDIAANKIEHIRAGLGINPEQVKSARRDDDINILAIAADFVDEKKAVEMVKAFIETEFEGAERRTRRLEEIKKIENS